MKIPRVDSSNVGVLLIDVQPAFIGPAFSDGGPPLEALIFLLEDGLFTTEPYPGPALRRRHQAGAVPTTLHGLRTGAARRPDPLVSGVLGTRLPTRQTISERVHPPERWPAREPTS